jgi:hypothetical protein
MPQKIELYYYSYMKSMKSWFIKTNNVHDTWIFLLNHITGNIMIIFIVIALKLAQTFVVTAKYKLNLLLDHQA